MSRRLLILAALLLPLAAAAGDARVAVASNFLPTLRLLAEDFASQTGHRLRISSASSGKLYAQILNGAPFELFLSADSLRPQRLLAEGAVADGRIGTYARGRLVLWLPRRQTDAEGCRALLSSSPGLRLAMANPRTAPYGQAAWQALTALGLEPEKMNLVFGDNVAQAWTFANSGAVDGGLVAAAQLRPHHPGCRWLLPEKLHSPLDQQAVLLERGEDNPAAQAFFRYLFGPTARRLIAQAGYQLP